MQPNFGLCIQTLELSFLGQSHDQRHICLHAPVLLQPNYHPILILSCLLLLAEAHESLARQQL